MIELLIGKSAGSSEGRTPLPDSDEITDRPLLRTVGRGREDGAYVVERRGAAAGHRKVFDSFADCRACFDALPATFVAIAVEWPGVTGRRRHMLVHHFAEHPAFPCRLVGRQPLCARKRGDGDR